MSFAALQILLKGRA